MRIWKARWDFRFCQVTDTRLDTSILHADWKPGNQEVKGLCGFGEPRPYSISQRKSSGPGVTIPRHKGPRCWGHTCHVKLNNGPVQLLHKAKAVHSHEPAVYFCFPSGHWAKEHFPVRWRLCNWRIVTQWQEFTIKFTSTTASHKVTGLVWFPEKEALRFHID